MQYIYRVRPKISIFLLNSWFLFSSTNCKNILQFCFISLLNIGAGQQCWNWHQHDKNQSRISLIAADLIKSSFVQSICPFLSDVSVPNWSDLTASGSSQPVCELLTTQRGTHTPLHSTDHSHSVALNLEDALILRLTILCCISISIQCSKSNQMCNK